MMATAMPAGPTFFCTPPQMSPYLLTSQGRERNIEDWSETRTFPFVSGSLR